MRLGGNPFEAERCIPHPLILTAHSLLPNWLWTLGLLAADIISSLLLENLFPKVGGVFYLLNPFSGLTFVAKSLSGVETMLFVLFIYSLLRKRITLASFVFALASLLSFYPIVQLPILLFAAKRIGKLRNTLCSLLVAFSVLFFWSKTKGDFAECTIGCHLGFLDLKPNIGLWWYLMTEMFDHFRSFFLVTLQLNAFLHAIPLCLKFLPLNNDNSSESDQEILFVSCLVQLLVNILKPYPTLSDISLFLTIGYSFLPSLTSHNPQIAWNLKALYCYGGSFLLLITPSVYSLWMVQGSGNANFYFAAICAVSLLQMIGIVMAVKLKLEQLLIRANPGIDLQKCSQ